MPAPCAGCVLTVEGALRRLRWRHRPGGQRDGPQEEVEHPAARVGDRHLGGMSAETNYLYMTYSGVEYDVVLGPLEGRTRQDARRQSRLRMLPHQLHLGV